MALNTNRSRGWPEPNQESVKKGDYYLSFYDLIGEPMTRKPFTLTEVLYPITGVDESGFDTNPTVDGEEPRPDAYVKFDRSHGVFLRPNKESGKLEMVTTNVALDEILEVLSTRALREKD